MKFCIDCKHCLIPATGVEYARCGLASKATLNLVTGETKIDGEYCAVRRLSACGPSAIDFEPKTAEQVAA